MKNQKIIIIGTLHANLTTKHELQEIIENHKPDQILVEVVDNDIKTKQLKKYPPEMIFTIKWSQKNKIPVSGFDSKINIFKKGVTQSDNQKLIEKQKKLMKNLTWKDFNKKENEKLLNIDELDEVIDPKKEKMREKEMLKNIQNKLPKNGNTIIITGISHLNFFETNLKTAIFPLRK